MRRSGPGIIGNQVYFGLGAPQQMRQLESMLFRVVFSTQQNVFECNLPPSRQRQTFWWRFALGKPIAPSSTHCGLKQSWLDGVSIYSVWQAR